MRNPNPSFENMKTETLEMNTQKEETLDSESGKSETKPRPREDQTLGFDTQSPVISGTESMVINDDDVSMVEVSRVGKSFSVPRFLRELFRKEVGEGDGGDHKLLVIAVHAVLLESGFIAFDSVSNMKVEGFHLPDEWPSLAFTMSLCYTLPEIIDEGPSAAVNGVEAVELKFQSLGKYVVIYGSLTKNGSGPYRVCLDEDCWGFFLNLLWANCDSIDEMNGKDTYLERDVLEFWKTVKDRLALPLLIDLCDKAGLAPPPCFMGLPSDIKLKILGFLPGVDVAKAGCVCSELHNLSSTDDLWRQKFVQQFGNVERFQFGNIERFQGRRHWKERFGKSWETRKRKRKRTASPGRFVCSRIPCVGREPMPLVHVRVPRIIDDLGLVPAYPRVPSILEELGLVPVPVPAYPGPVFHPWMSDRAALRQNVRNVMTRSVSIPRRRQA